MSEITVHSVAGSPFGRAVLATLEEKGAPYRFVQIAPGAFRGAAHLARHPFGRVPAIAHDGFDLYETQAILRYLDRVLPTPQLTPPEPRGAARMDQLMNIGDWYLFQGVGNVIAFERIVKPRIMGQPPDQSRIAAALPAARAVCTELARMLGDGPFFTGPALTLADLSLAPHLDMLAATPEWADFGAPHANLRGWLALMNARPSMHSMSWERVAALAAA